MNALRNIVLGRCLRFNYTLKKNAYEVTGTLSTSKVPFKEPWVLQGYSSDTTFTHLGSFQGLTE
jgi:hypothetical protein